ncbi:inhibitor of nuclear factor kappa-B kinase-interacting protein isoform X2 [Entelurus aequoreus]|uniref:inhibitor of nuclear factor kappa-B kinase-interacting protein isoform X2 n=1 Tax=Entelurus aequoreus TaxID=161455 RepID=UPI002B1E7267|nr:inhibitor of nuclear factor kappa-B kinase-interacting protein isoform X2 [Entelurus aequoreus]
MPTEVKQRKKKQSEDVPANCQQEVEQRLTKEDGDSPKTSSLDFKGIMCVLSLAVCAALSWEVIQQNERFSNMEEKFTLLHGKTSSWTQMEEQVEKMNQKCEGVHLQLDDVDTQRQALQTQLESLAQDVSRLKEWASGLSEKRSERQVRLDALTGAVDQIEEKTSAITKDFGNKVVSVRTDVRRMDGLSSEVDSLLAQVSDLEDRASQAEHSMVKRIGDVLAGSIDRVSNLRAASERNTQALEQLRRRLPELDAADQDISERLRELESGRARLIRTVSFAGDLKPKVAAIKRDLSAFEPRLSDLTLRIGNLAEDIGKRGEETVELRHALDNLTASDVSDQALLSEFKETLQPV